jgi:ABC-type molybdate transport system substrate-binding protein
VDNTKLRLTIASHIYMGWSIVSNINISNNGTTLSAGSIPNAFDKKAYTTNSFIDNCQISYSSPNALTDWNVVGLSEVKNITKDQTDIKYGFQILGTGSTATLSRIQNGTTYPLAASYSDVLPTDILKITYDGEYIRFYKNEILVADPINRTEKTPLHGVVAMSIGNSKIKNLNFSEYPNKVYGKYSDLRSGVNFAIYINSDDAKNDLFKIISINEVSSNEYAISAMKYEEEKFNIIEKNSYIDKNQQKQIIFSTDNVINEIFNDAEVSSSTKLSTVNYVTAASFDYDYSFYIEEEVLNDNYFNSQYESIKIDFISLFSILDNRAANNVFGIMCVINRNGKTLTFNILKSNQTLINVFLGETQAGNVIYKTSLDFYAFDLNYKIFNV